MTLKEGLDRTAGGTLPREATEQDWIFGKAAQVPYRVLERLMADNA